MPLLLEDTAPQPSTSFWNRFLKNKDNKNSFITFRDNDLQMNMSYSYDTPFGYYFYPVTEAYKQLKDSENFSSSIPFAGDRPLIVWADLDRSFANKVLRIDKEGNSQYSDNYIWHKGMSAWFIFVNSIEFIDEYDKNIMINYLEVIKLIRHIKNIKLLDTLEDKNSSNLRQLISNYNFNENKFLTSYFNNSEDDTEINNKYDDLLRVVKSIDSKYTLETNLYKGFSESNMDSKKNTQTNRFWYFTYKLCNNSKKWTRLLYKLGFVGVVDEGSGTIHTNEPYQAVFFVSAALGGLTVYKNPKDVTQLNFGDQDIVKNKETKSGIHDFTIEKFVQQYCMTNSFISYDKATNTITGDIYLNVFYENNNIKGQDTKRLPVFLKDKILKGELVCTGIGLTSLVNSPKRIMGFYDVSDNPITTLEGSPEYIEDKFYCNRTHIKDLRGICNNIGGGIWLKDNKFLTNISDVGEFGGKINLSECPMVNLDKLDSDILIRVILNGWDDRYIEYVELLKLRGYDENKNPIKKESFKITSNKFKDYILREEVFNRGQLDLEAAWEVYQKQYLKSTGNTFTKELFFDRARNWTFYGNIEGWVAVRHQASGYVKLVAVAGSMKGKFYGMNELLQTNPPLWGAVTSDIADMLKKKGFIVPNYITMKILIANVPPAVFGGKKVNINFDGSIDVDYDGIGTQKKWFVCNKTYVKKFLNENTNVPEIVKTALMVFI